MEVVSLGNWDFTQDENGNWLYKAKDKQPLKSSDKPVYREKPQFPVQEEIEGESKNRFMKVVNATVVEVTKYIKDNLQ